MAVSPFHQERLSELIRREIAEVIAHKVRDPRIPAVVTIARIKLAPDNRNATVFVSFLEEKIKNETVIEALNNAAPFIQRIVAAKISVKHFPRLYFKYDDTIEHTNNINRLLKEIQHELG